MGGRKGEKGGGRRERDIVGGRRGRASGKSWFYGGRKGVNILDVHTCA